MTKKEARVWAHLLGNRRASPEEVADKCDVGVAFVEGLIARIGTPEEVWRNEDSAPLPDTNPKTAYGEAKPKLSSTPFSALWDMGAVFELGAAKYGRFNWRAHEVSATVYFDAAMRHLSAWMDGEATDPESAQSHLAHVMACMAILIDAEKTGKLNDNRHESPD